MRTPVPLRHLYACTVLRLYARTVLCPYARTVLRLYARTVLRPYAHTVLCPCCACATLYQIHALMYAPASSKSEMKDATPLSAHCFLSSILVVSSSLLICSSTILQPPLSVSLQVHFLAFARSSLFPPIDGRTFVVA